MASTYLSLHYHLVFATKNGETVITPEWRSRNRTAEGVGAATPPGSLGWCYCAPVVSLRSTTG